MFQKATKKQAKLRLTLDGPSGSGKTYSALVLAKALGGRVAVVDTEHGSASKYADLFQFDAAEPEDFGPETYIRAIRAAEAAKYDVLILDSLSHAWSGKGGALELVDKLGGSAGKGFTSGWRKVTPMHTALIDAMLAYPGHLIATMRTKMEYILEKDERGKDVPRKVGMAPIQREGMEYEFDLVVDLDLDGKVTVSKTRCPAFSGTAGLLKHADVESMGKRLLAWLGDGAPATPPPPPVAAAPVPAAPAAAPPAPVSGERSVLEALAQARNRIEVEATLPRIRALSKAGQDAVRDLYVKRISEVA